MTLPFRISFWGRPQPKGLGNLSGSGHFKSLLPWARSHHLSGVLKFPCWNWYPLWSNLNTKFRLRFIIVAMISDPRWQNKEKRITHIKPKAPTNFMAFWNHQRCPCFAHLLPFIWHFGSRKIFAYQAYQRCLLQIGVTRRKICRFTWRNSC